MRKLLVAGLQTMGKVDFFSLRLRGNVEILILGREGDGGGHGKIEFAHGPAGGNNLFCYLLGLKNGFNEKNPG